MRKVISSIGVELEGIVPYYKVEDMLDFLKNKYESKGLIKSVEAHHDGSIEVEGSNETDIELTFWTYASDYSRVAELFGTIYDEISEKYGFYQNNSCGNHQHLRLSSTVFYYILSLPTTIYQFKQKYIEKFKNKSKYISRLSNHYAKEFSDVNDIDDNEKGGDRYHYLNFSSIYKHSDTRTIEIRVMPWTENGKEYSEITLFNLETVDELVWQNYVQAKKAYLREHGRELFFSSTKYYSARLSDYLWANVKDRLLLLKIKKIAEKIPGVRINIDYNGISIYHDDEFIKRIFEHYIDQNVMYKNYDVFLIRDGHRKEVLEYLVKLLRFESYAQKENLFNNTWFQDVLLGLRQNHPSIDYNYLPYYIIMYSRLAQLFS